MAILDAYGRPMAAHATAAPAPNKSVLISEHSAPTVSGVRSVLSDHPTRGLTPSRLARILVAAEQGDAMAYLELAEDMEEKDLHYLGVLGTRKRQVAQLEITVEAASDDQADVENADLVREWLRRDTLQTELVDVLDAVGKGFSVTEILWETSESQWWPATLKWRDPRWFQFDRIDGETIRLRDGSADGADLPNFKYIRHVHPAKSGIPIRGGLARAVAWSWMFKNFGIKDWVVFAEVYGQPIRVGKYPASATDADREILLRAVSSLGSDAAAIIPDSMLIELIEAKSAGGASGSAGGTVFQGLAEFLDKQVSKAVLGQTGTTDVGQHVGTAKVHDEVREDIETADAALLAATLNRDLVRPYILLNRGPQQRYPVLKVGRAERYDPQETADVLSKLVPLGLKVGMSTVRDRLGWPDPDPDEELLAPIAGAAQPVDPDEDAPNQAEARVRGWLAAAHAAGAGTSTAPEAIAAQAEREAAAATGAMIGRLRQLVDQAHSLDEVAAGLLRAYPDMDPAVLADTLELSLTLAQLLGRSDVIDGR